MSGGLWNYQDVDMGNFGGDLEIEDDDVLRRTGALIRQLSDYLALADRYLSGDSDQWLDERPKLQRIVDAIDRPGGAV